VATYFRYDGYWYNRFLGQWKNFINRLRFDAVIVARVWHIFGGTQCIFHVEKLVVWSKHYRYWLHDYSQSVSKTSLWYSCDLHCQHHTEELLPVLVITLGTLVSLDQQKPPAWCCTCVVPQLTLFSVFWAKIVSSFCCKQQCPSFTLHMRLHEQRAFFCAIKQYSALLLGWDLQAVWQQCGGSIMQLHWCVLSCRLLLLFWHRISVFLDPFFVKLSSFELRFTVIIF